jgi:hypothetical protein
LALLIDVQAERTEYCIHRTLVGIHAPAWLRDLEGKTEPVILESVKTSELDALLCIMYPTCACFLSPISFRLTIYLSDVCRRDISSAADWTSVLRLATRWHFSSFRTLALQTLDPTASPLQKLFLARELDVPDWLLPAHVTLCLREEPLSLSEMRLLPLEDVHLVVTVRERLHTSKVAATVEDVSEHVQPLIAASVETFTPKSGADIMTPSSDEHLSAPTPTLSPPPITTTPIVTATDAVIKADRSQAETTFDPVAMRKALEEAAYDRAVANISSADSEEASHIVAKWASDCCNAWPSDTCPLRDLVYAFVHRCAREGSFSDTAADTLARCKNSGESQGKNFFNSNRTMYCGVGDCLQWELCAVITPILGASPLQLDCHPSGQLGKVIYGRTERWLTNTTFALRLGNCIVFVGTALKAGLMSGSDVAAALGNISAQALYQRLLALGHLLDSCPSSVDGLLKGLDNRCQWWYHTSAQLFEEHRKWLTVSMLCCLVKISQERIKPYIRKY